MMSHLPEGPEGMGEVDTPAEQTNLSPTGPKPTNKNPDIKSQNLSLYFILRPYRSTNKQHGLIG